MDIRLFKFLIFLGLEIALALALYLYPVVRFFLPVHYSIIEAHKMLMLLVPILVILPEDNWIWIVEENPRGRKISLRSKAVKHLHLFMLYIGGMSVPPLLMCIALIRGTNFYTFELTPIFAASAFIYGIFCAWKNFVNIKTFESLFAVAWDRRSAFFELFVGFKVSRKPYFFYSGFALLCGLLLLAGSVAVPWFYYMYVKSPDVIYDAEKTIAMSMLFHFSLVTGIWGTTMYIVFQAFFSRKLQNWLNKPKEDRHRN